jgi:hypothetical protein
MTSGTAVRGLALASSHTRADVSECRALAGEAGNASTGRISGDLIGGSSGSWQCKGSQRTNGTTVMQIELMTAQREPARYPVLQ